MLDFDPTRSWTDFEERLAEVDDDRDRRHLRVVIAHVRAEIERDIDAVMATLVSEPRFHVWVAGRDIGPKGREAVRSYYEQFLWGGGAVFESRKDRIAIDGRTITHEGPVRNLVSGAIARRRGYNVPSESGHYLVHFRNAVWWSFDEGGFAMGEDSYTTMDPDAWEPVAEADLPAMYVDYLAEITSLQQLGDAGG